MLYLLKFFAIVFLVIFLIGMIARIVLQSLFKRMGKKYGFYQEKQTRPEGDVTVNPTKPKSKIVNKDVGDYVDFEEVKRSIIARDIADENRDISPLRRADDALVLDNSRMTVADQMEWVKKIIEDKMHGNRH